MFMYLPKIKTPLEIAPEDALKAKAKTIARLVQTAAHHGPYRARCLQQSLVLWLLLRANGMNSEIRFGARKLEGRMEAHAWVECSGLPVNDRLDVCEWFSPFRPVESYKANS